MERCPCACRGAQTPCAVPCLAAQLSVHSSFPAPRCQVPRITLAEDSRAGDEDSDPAEWGDDYDDDEEEGGRLTLEPLAGIPNLVGLEVARDMRLPPDWRSLATLRSLAVKCSHEVQWGAAPKALTRLTSLRLHAGALRERCRFPASLCALRALRQLTVGLPLGSWISMGNEPLRLPAAFSKVTALTRLELKHLRLDEAPVAMLAEQLPNLAVVRRGHGTGAGHF